MFSRDRTFGLNDFSHIGPMGKAVIYFLGNEFCFSDGLLRMLSTEFPSVAFLRASGFAEIGQIRSRYGQGQFLVIDERHLTDPADAAMIAQAAGTDALILAYHGARPAAGTVALMQAYHGARPTQQSQRGFGDEEVLRLGLLPLDVQVDVLVSMMRLLLCGEFFIPDDVHRMLVQSGGSAPPVQPKCSDRVTSLNGHRDLTRREWEVLALLAEGKQNKIVAADLGLSEHTVKLHIHHLISKLGVTNRTGAVIWYLAQEEAEPPASEPE